MHTLAPSWNIPRQHKHSQSTQRSISLAHVCAASARTIVKLHVCSHIEHRVVVGLTIRGSIKIIRSTLPHTHTHSCLKPEYTIRIQTQILKPSSTTTAATALTIPSYIDSIYKYMYATMANTTKNVREWDGKWHRTIEEAYQLSWSHHHSAFA